MRLCHRAQRRSVRMRMAILAEWSPYRRPCRRKVPPRVGIRILAFRSAPPISTSVAYFPVPIFPSSSFARAEGRFAHADEAIPIVLLWKARQQDWKPPPGLLSHLAKPAAAQPAPAELLYSAAAPLRNVSV